MSVAAMTLALGLAACSSQDTVPLDLDGTIPLVEPPDNANAANDVASTEGRRLAIQQCLDDSELVEGVVQIAQPDTGVVVAEIVVQCSEVR